MKINELYTKRVIDLIESHKSVKKNSIFVLMGQTGLLEIESLKDKITDPDTFLLDKDSSVFTYDWWMRMNNILYANDKEHLLSYAQFSYLQNYVKDHLYIDRIVILKDNLRQIFPIERSDYIESERDENIETRPDNLPIYMSEQLILDGHTYYSIKKEDESFTTIELFSDTRTIESTEDETLETIDISSDFASIDSFINQCIQTDNFRKRAAVRLYSKHPLSAEIKGLLERLNSVMHKFGGEILLLKVADLKQRAKVSDTALEMYSKYWPNGSGFDNITFYKNPNIGNELMEISQGVIVDTILHEYQNTKNNKPWKDIFLTAPTGAGKSLLFQLPAFHISEMGEVTIVVSPLIALMKDQVEAIVTERKFSKVAYLNSELSFFDREKIIEDCKKSHIDILYMSPELMLSYDIKHFIGDRRLGLLVIDEAHLITTWGRDFRVDYWFLGNHLWKMRKYHDLKFPMVAVTATAIYGGSNDMVFDSTESLVMHDPHLFIGQVKRNNIEFIVNNYDSFTQNYEANKLNQTSEFIKEAAKLRLKTLIYTPFTRHITELLKVNTEEERIATGYFGSMTADNRELAYREFKNGSVRTMIATKAFGMGVDIKDIQLIYHHAPSGLLPDYVQEIGRAARNPKDLGYAALNYSSKDQRYSKALHGMSAIRQYQLREILKKIFNLYIKNGKKRNLLISSEDFGYIFDSALDLDQKVLTSLMMIEKDYLAKHRFNVLVARPKKLFVKVYARIPEKQLEYMTLLYHGKYTILESTNDGYNILEIDLDKLWSEHFIEKSFPKIKNEFFNGRLLKTDGIDLNPMLRMSFWKKGKFDEIYGKLERLLEAIKKIFANQKGYFSEDQFIEELRIFGLNDENTNKISKFILSTYSGRLLGPGVIEKYAFLQYKKNIDKIEYKVFNNRFIDNFSSLLRRLHILFGNNQTDTAERFITKKESTTIDYIRLGELMEILELGSFEVKGGDNPMIFIRLNDPNRIERDSKNKSYRNSLLSSTLERHNISNMIFDHFFMRSFSNEERWNFIEDFFLGTDVDTLIEKYKGGDVNKVDIIEELKKKDLIITEAKDDSDPKSNIHVFPPKKDRTYQNRDLMTLHTNSGSQTMRVDQWLRNDPVAFHMAMHNISFRIDKATFGILRSKLIADHPKYLSDFLGLKTWINFNGYDKMVQASVPYENKPVEFYKWWCKNQESVKLSLTEKIKLFDKVDMIDKNILIPEHRKLIRK